MYNGYLNIGGEKMLKLLGNFFIVCELLELWFGEVICYVLFIVYYCKLLDWIEDLLFSVKFSFDCLYGVLWDMSIDVDLIL